MESQFIKMIWDFRGADAEGTAKHHEIHLKEFSVASNVENFGTGVMEMSPFWYLAFVIVHVDQLETVRDRLRPHRAEYVHVE